MFEDVSPKFLEIKIKTLIDRVRAYDHKIKEEFTTKNINKYLKNVKNFVSPVGPHNERHWVPKQHCMDIFLFLSVQEKKVSHTDLETNEEGCVNK